MKRILVGDDGSNAALSAVEQATELAAKTGAELIALAVFDHGDLGARNAKLFALAEDIDVAEVQDAVLNSATDYLDRCREIASKWGVASYRAKRLAARDTALAMIETAKQNDVDLIVVGSRGYSRLPGLLLGSVSQKLASHAPCSVMVARARSRG